MANWLEQVARLLEAETSDLGELARMVGADPRVFYRGADFRDADLTDEDLNEFDLTGAQIRRARMKPKDAQRLFSRQLAELLRDAGLDRMPGNPRDSGNWAAYARLIPHVQALLASGEAPDVELWDYLLSQSGYYLSRIADHQGCLTMAQESLRNTRARLSEDHRNVAVAHANLAGAFQHLGRFAEAEVELARAVALLEAYRPGSADLADHYGMLGVLLLEIARNGAPERLAEAARRHQQALALLRRLFGRRSEPVAEALNNLGVVREVQARARSAARLSGAALTIWRATLPAGDARLAHSAMTSGARCLEAGEAEQAEPLLREALEIHETVFAAQPQHPERQNAADWLISCLLTRAGAGVNRGAREAEAKRLCAQYGFDFAEQQAHALRYLISPKDRDA